MKKRILSGIVLILAMILFAGCIPNEEAGAATPEDALAAAMTAMTADTQSGQKIFLGSDGQPIAPAANEGLALEISRLVTYSVTSVETDGDTATAQLEITAPDAAQLVKDALAGMETFDAEAFTVALEALLADEPAMKTFTVTVKLTRIDGAWYVLSNAEYANAITGGLVEAYNTVRQNIIDGLQKGGA